MTESGEMKRGKKRAAAVLAEQTQGVGVGEPLQGFYVDYNKERAKSCASSIVVRIK